MTWKGVRPVVHLIDKLYENGISLTKKELKPYLKKLNRSLTLPKWDVYFQGAIG
jgi:hypothetical protein